MIEIKDLKFGYKKDKILFDNLNLTLKTGSIYGLLGKNGAGKTSLLKQITGLNFPNSGSVLINGIEAKKRTPQLLEEIFIVPEEFELPAMTIEKFVEVNASFYPKFNNELFTQCMIDFEISPKKKLNQMSFGQKKKVMLAFGISTQTNVLILDEPTNALDIPSKSIFRKIVSNILTDDRMIIISTHQVRDLESLIDTVVILDEGKIILNHSISEISEKMAFVKIDETMEPESILYQEETFGSKIGIIENNNELDTRLDLEILFKGIVSNTEKMNNIFNN